MLSPDETLQETHRHFSHAMAIEPLCMLRYENPQDRSVIDATVDHLVHLGSGQWVGFSFGWMALLQITRNNGKGALYELHRFAEHFLSPNGFHLNGDYKNSGVCDFTIAPLRWKQISSRHTQYKKCCCVPKRIISRFYRPARRAGKMNLLHFRICGQKMVY